MEDHSQGRVSRLDGHEMRDEATAQLDKHGCCGIAGCTRHCSERVPVNFFGVMFDLDMCADCAKAAKI